MVGSSVAVWQLTQPALLRSHVLLSLDEHGHRKRRHSDRLATAC
jgi:hypothetical protein